MGDVLNFLFYEPIYNAIIVLYRLFDNNLALAIIGIALIARILMVPLTLKQIKMAESSQEFSAKVKEVKKMYKHDKEKQNAEMLKLQSEYLPAQLAGCLPMIFQFVLFIQMYRVIKNLIDVGASGFNEVAYNFVDKFPAGTEINHDFLGVFDMTKSASDAGFGSLDALPYILLVIGVGASQFASTKVLMALKSKKKEEKEEKKEKGEKEQEDFAEILQRSTRQTMYIMPLLLVFIAYGLPSGLSFYWISQSGFVIIQQALISRLKLSGKDDVQTGEVRVDRAKNEGERLDLPAGQAGVSGESGVKKKFKKKDKKKKKNKRRR